MTLSYQLYGMLKSTYIIMKRNKCLTIIEFLTPSILIIFFFVLSLFFQKEEQKYDNDDIKFLFQYSSNYTNKVMSSSQIITDLDDINNSTPIQYKKFLYQCENHTHVALIGKNFPKKIENKISEYFWELPDMTTDERNNFFIKYNSINEFNEYITSENYGTDKNKYPKICFGISKDDNKKYGFGIHYDTLKENNFIIDVPKIPDFKTSKYEKIKTQTDLKSFQYYQYSGYLMVMKIIYDYIIQEVSDKPDAEINFSLVEMIYDSIFKNKFHKYIYLLGFFIIISYAIILSINIYREINFKETKKKDYLKCMGLKERIFFLSSFIRSIIINIFHSVLTALIIKLILKQSQYIYLFIILFLYGLVIFSMTYFFQSFQQKSRKGVIMSLLCYCIMCFLYLPINSPVVNKNIINLFCVLFPPVNLMFGFDVLFIYEKEFHKFDNITNDVGQITILEMIIFLFLNFILYLIFGYIIMNCFKCKNGKSSRKIEKINIENPNIEKEINLGEHYIDNDNDSEHSDLSSLNQKRNMFNKDFRLRTQDIINTPEEMPTYRKKIGLLTTRLMTYKNDIQSHLFDISNDTNSISNNIYIDELEKNFKMQKERQTIRRKRRALGKSIYDLKEEEYFVNNLDLSVIQEVIPIDAIPKKEVENLVSETSSAINENNVINKGEFNLKKDEINPGQKLEIKKLEKYYNIKGDKHKKKIVLNELDCTLYDNEIFALLGENGAGKSTFISIIGGLIDANGGSIIYKKDMNDKGYDILDPDKNYQFKEILGICPQNNNILFNDLTVEENLEIFCILKYKKDKNLGKKSNEGIKEEVQYLLKKFDLNEEKIKHCYAKNLSGGQKRKLCIAIACCGKSKIIILDEPTGGIDVASRNNIWKILKTLKNEEKIIILISHSMEEVSYLADKIGILKEGKLIRQGTSRELIDKYGQFYTLIINQKMNEDKAKELTKYISKNYYFQKDSNINNLCDKSTEKTDTTKSSSNDSTIKFEVFREKVVIKISNENFIKEKSAQLFDELNKIYGIKKYIIIEDQLEDVFINTINKTSQINSKFLENEYMIILSSNENLANNKWISKITNELKVSFFKNCKAIRNLISEIIFPIILILIACLVSYIEFLEENQSSNINLINLNHEFQNVYYENLANIPDSDYYIIQRIIEEEKQKDILKNFKFGSVEIFDKNSADLTISEIILYYLKVIDINKKNGTLVNNYADYLLTNFNNKNHQYEFISFLDTKRKHSPIFYTNYLLNCIIKYVIKKENEYNYNMNYDQFVKEISIFNSPFPMSYEEKKNKKSRNGFSLVFFTSIAFALIPSNIITSILKEKENKLKHLQILSGLSLCSYWLNNYIFELIKYFIISICSYIILILFDFEDKYLIVLYILYGPAMISFTYFLSYFIDNEGHGQTISLLINLLFGTLGSSAIMILRTNEDAINLGKILSYFFRIVPSFCLSYGYNELISKDLLFSIDNHLEKINSNSDYIINYVKDDIIFLVLEIIIYTALLIVIEQKDYLMWKICKKYYYKRYHSDRKEKINDKLEDNKYKKQNGEFSSESILKNKNKGEKEDKRKKDKGKKEDEEKIEDEKTPILSVDNIRKNFKFKTNCFNLCKKRNKLVLDDITFKVDKGECFGLIGTNGAGKTTCFRCLCMEIKPDSGIIKIDNTNIFDYYSNKKPSIGYCPQFDSIFEYLTVRQNLYYFGKLKGFSDNNLKIISDSIIKCLDLDAFENILCKNLSGGNKRKLSVGISILARPNVIFLDEPSTGMDPYTRRLLLNLLNYGYLKNKKNGKSEFIDDKGIILTTHSLEEIEALCDRVGILINGKMNKERIGTINDLINNNKKGIILNIEFKKPKQNDLTKNYERICEERIENKNELKNFLKFMKKDTYIKYIKDNSLAKDLLYLLKSNKSISKYTVLVWIKYMDYLHNLVTKLKKSNFNQVTCIDFKLNNFILEIKNTDKDDDQCDSYIFGLLESNKNSLFLEEYSYTLTTFEKIFLEFCEQAYQDNEKVEQPFEIESEFTDKIKIEL